MKVKYFEIVSEQIIQRWLDESPKHILFICHPDCFNAYIYYREINDIIVPIDI